MIVLLNLFVMFCVTFANEENNNEGLEMSKRFYGNSWQSSMENNRADPILAYVTRLNSNLQPMSARYLSNLYNIYTPEPAVAYFNDDAQEYISSNHFSRKNANAAEKEITFHCEYFECPSKTHSCESIVEIISEDGVQVQVITQCLSITNEVLINKTSISSDVTSGMYYFEIQRKAHNKEPEVLNDGNNYQADYGHPLSKECPETTESPVTDVSNDGKEFQSDYGMDVISKECRGKGESQETPGEPQSNEVFEELETRSDVSKEEVILHCDFLKCPSQTHNCKSTFNVFAEDYNEIEVITQCLSIMNEVLIERTTISKNPFSDRYYFEIKSNDDEIEQDENIEEASKILLAARLGDPTKIIKNESFEEIDQQVLSKIKDHENDINVDSELLLESSEYSYEDIDLDNSDVAENLYESSELDMDTSNETDNNN